MKNTIADTQYVIKKTLTRLFVFLYSLAIIAMNPIPTRIDNISIIHIITSILFFTNVMIINHPTKFNI